MSLLPMDCLVAKGLHLASTLQTCQRGKGYEVYLVLESVEHVQLITH